MGTSGTLFGNELERQARCVSDRMHLGQDTKGESSWQPSKTPLQKSQNQPPTS